MTNEELIIILKEFETTRVENLNDNSKKLFYAIMKIADERDELKEENQKIKKYYEYDIDASKEIIAELEKENQRLNNVLNELEKWLKSKEEIRCDDCFCLNEVLDKLKELKESDK